MTHEAMHPASRYTYDEILQGLEERARAGLVRKTVCPDNVNLTLYCYTQRAVVDRAWDDFVIIARGIVLNTASKTIAALPFPKFFNYGERPEDAGLIHQQIHHVTEKLDGSLIIAFFDDDKSTWRCATKGSFTSPQAVRAYEMLGQMDHELLDRGNTYLFEIVYHADRKVIRYDRESLTMLAAYRHGSNHPLFGVELDRAALQIEADRVLRRVVERHEFATGQLDQIAATCEELGRDREGFVVCFRNGARLKFKGREYLRLHRLISNVTPLFVWQAMRAGDNLSPIRRDLPEEFWEDFDRIESLLQGQFNALVARVEAEARRHEGKTDKELGLSLKEVPADVRPYVFAPRKHGPEWFGFEQNKTWNSLWASLRPTGNVLDGYVQSTSLQAVQSDV